MLKCIGQAAAQAAPADLTTAAAETMSRQFLAPCLFTCRDSERLREAVLTAVSELAQALKRMRSAGVHIVSREMVGFEWLRAAGTAEFKDYSINFLQ